MKRKFKKNYKADGWPIQDAETGVNLDKDEVIELLNIYHEISKKEKSKNAHFEFLALLKQRGEK